MKSVYLEEHPWKIIESQFDPQKVKASESIFSLGNGAMGQRANFEEQYSGPSFQGSYIAGVYYPDKTRVGWWKNGYPEYFAKVLNAPNWIGIDVSINKQPLDLHLVEVNHFRRELDMKNGCYTREVQFALADGTEGQLKSIRFLSLNEWELGAIHYTVEILKGQAEVEITPYVDGGIKNEDANWDDPFWKHLETFNAGNFSALRSSTLKSNFDVCTYMHTQLVSHDLAPEVAESATKVSHRYATVLQAGENLTLHKYGGYLQSMNHQVADLIPAAQQLAQKAAATGWEALQKAHAQAWHTIWETADIQIDGDVAAQQAIRFNIFQLNQTYSGKDARLNIGPKGFTGEKYGGSTYWDTEAYCLPFYMATKSETVARNLLQYRYNQLDKAIENAEKLGFRNGAALYPMVTMNGEECHNEWEITFEEIHRNGAIAYAIFNYTRYTADESYIPEMGLEVLIGIARFWEQRVSFSTPKNKYVMLGVTGPNEYENNVNNNWYTNYIARWCLQYAAQQAEVVAKTHAADFERIQRKTTLTKAECKQWEQIASQLYLPYDEAQQLYLQQDGFLDKELLPASELPPNERPINQHWSWDRILRSPYIKQADVLQGFYFFADDFSADELQRHYDFYEPLTVHESSLSPCVHAILAARLGNKADAYRFYLQTARLDLDDYNKEVHEGLHITSMAGTWMSIVEGFAGMQIQQGALSFRPQLPKQWKAFSFKILYKKAPLEVQLTTAGCQFIWHGKAPISILVDGEQQTLQPYTA